MLCYAVPCCAVLLISAAHADEAAGMGLPYLLALGTSNMVEFVGMGGWVCGCVQMTMIRSPHLGDEFVQNAVSRCARPVELIACNTVGEKTRVRWRCRSSAQVSVSVQGWRWLILRFTEICVC